MTPPVAVTVATPLDSPLQTTGVSSVALADNAAGSVMITVAVVVQPFASVTTTSCEPAVKPVAVAVVSALSHAYR